MSPLSSDGENSPEFWRQWNAAAAPAYAAHNLGQDFTAPDFGQFEAQYNRNAALAALPFKDRQTALMNQHQIQQDSFRNDLSLMQERRMQNAEMFDQRMNAARMAAKSDQMDTAARRLQYFERAYGHNPLEVLEQAEADPESLKRGTVRLASRFQYDPVTMKDREVPGREIRFTPSYLNELRGLRDQLYGRPSITIDNIVDSAMGQFRPSFNSGVPASALAAAAPSPSGGLSPEKQARKAELMRKMQEQGPEVAAYLNQMSPQDFGYPN